MWASMRSHEKFTLRRELLCSFLQVNPGPVAHCSTALSTAAVIAYLYLGAPLKAAPAMAPNGIASGLLGFIGMSGT